MVFDKELEEIFNKYDLKKEIKEELQNILNNSNDEKINKIRSVIRQEQLRADDKISAIEYIIHSDKDMEEKEGKMNGDNDGQGSSDIFKG